MVAPDAVFYHGGTRSGLWAAVGPNRMKARGLDEHGLEEYYRSRNLLKAKVTAQHVAAAVLFFLSHQTPTTGATIPVDGGLPDATPRCKPIETAALVAALRKGTLSCSIVPVLAGSALRNKGIQPLLDAVCDFLPAPTEVPPIQGTDPISGQPTTRPPEDAAPFCALAFKVAMDEGRKTVFLRIYSGVLKRSTWLSRRRCARLWASTRRRPGGGAKTKSSTTSSCRATRWSGESLGLATSDCGCRCWPALDSALRTAQGVERTKLLLGKIVALSKTNFEAAMKLVEQSIEAQPDCPHFLLLKAKLSADRGRQDASDAAFDQWSHASRRTYPANCPADIVQLGD